jgi:hypothetical protein
MPLNANPNPKLLKRSTMDGQPREQRYTAADGSEYSVPLFRCLPGVSADAAAKELGGKIPGRGERGAAEAERRVVAAVTDGSSTYPVEVVSG